MEHKVQAEPCGDEDFHLPKYLGDSAEEEENDLMLRYESFDVTMLKFKNSLLYLTMQ